MAELKCDQIQKVLVVGAGTMGCQVAWLFAANELTVSVYDASTAALEALPKGLEKLARRFVHHGRLSRDQAHQALERIRITADADAAAAGSDLLSESVPENPDLKGRVLADFNRRCPSHTVFTTNTSTLVPSQFAAVSGRPERLAALHFHDVSLSLIVDVMPHAGTDPQIVGLLADFCRRIGQVPIVLSRESSGYVFNAMLSRLFEAALTLAANGVASVPDIDRSWMGVTYMPAGPFGIMDSIGLKTVHQICAYWAERSGDPQARANAAFVERMLAEGRLGVKNAKGFYTYPEPAFRRPDFLTAVDQIEKEEIP
jgi:3-hydroxybutyryl-CoA dehydrogenase